MTQPAFLYWARRLVDVTIDWAEVGAIAGIAAVVVAIVALYVAVLAIPKRAGDEPLQLPIPPGPFPNDLGTSKEVRADFLGTAKGFLVAVVGITMTVTAVVIYFAEPTLAALVLEYVGIVLFLLGCRYFFLGMARLTGPNRRMILGHILSWAGYETERK